MKILSFALILHVAQGFVVVPNHNKRSNKMALSAAAPELIDLHHLSNINDSLSHSMNILLADAAVVADADDGGWWQAYLTLFKNALVFIHDNIVEKPLKAAGVESTWGPSIALFTVFMRSLLVPLSIQQTKSSEYMKALKPYQKEIREKFKDNKEMINRATAKLFEDSGQNPLAGCLVSLAQLPILLGLYRSIRLLAKDGKLDESFLWIPSLQGPVSPPDYQGLDWLTSWTDGVPQLGWETTGLYLIMPVLLVLGQSLTMRALQPPIDENATEEEKAQLESTQGVLKFLPLFIGFFSLQVPAGLTIYWFTTNLFTLSQSLIIRKYYELNPPKIELPDYWDALDDLENMSPDERRKAAEAGLSSGPTFEDMVDEARYAFIVDRDTRLSDIYAASSSNGSTNSVPSELEVWVAEGSTTASKKEAEVQV